MGLHFSAPNLSGDVAQAGRFAGAERTAFLLRVVESRQASALIALLGAYALYTIAVGLHREFGGAKPPIEDEVRHRDERALPFFVAAAPHANAAAPAL